MIPALKQRIIIIHFHISSVSTVKQAYLEKIYDDVSSNRLLHKMDEYLKPLSIPETKNNNNTLSHFISFHCKTDILGEDI